MNLSNLLEKVAGKQRSFQADFGGLVRQLADGQELDAAVVARTLQDAGKTVDELRQAVELVQRRRQWHLALEQARKLESERTAIQQQLAQADQALTEAEQRHTEVTEPLYWRLEEIKQDVRDGDEARRRLWDTCGDPELLSACAELESELQTLSQRRIELCRRRDELRNAGRLDLERAAAAGASSEQQGLEERGRQRLRQAEALAKELARLDKRSAELQQREQVIREKMLQP
jgi:CRISPR/Cas system CSM-associated protein Csm2 small subunit